MTEGHLREVAEQRQLRLAGVKIYSRRRRPAAAPGILPHRPHLFGWSWLGALAIATLTWGSVVAFGETAEWWFERDTAVAGWFAERGTAWLDEFAETVRALGSAWLVRTLLGAASLVMIVTKRWRHLITFIAVVLVAEWAASRISVRPDQVETLQASIPMATVTASAIAVSYSLLPAGRWRNRWLMLTGMVLAAVGASRLYVAEDLFTDVLVGGALGVALTVTTFRLFVPDVVFPVSYAMGKKAHLSLEGGRAAAVRSALHHQLIDPASMMNAGVRSALRDQLGCELLACQVIDLKAFGLEGSAGSTPLRIKVAGEPDTYLFGKLYATNHLRSDRWYKLFRAITYGALEDERPFSTVRRLVEYEDYMQRVFHSAGLPSAEPFGVVSLSPEREYLVVTEFFEGSAEIDKVDMTDDIVDQGLGIIRLMWDSGLAHRDIKPANLLVADGQVKIIDVAFGTVRPTPWREAVDLANMMLVLALNRDPEDVYNRALEQFSAIDIAEGFAATQGVTMPSQLRSLVRQRKAETGVDLIEAFRSLAPECPPISIQRWSLRRVWVAAGAAFSVLTLAVLLFNNLRGADLL